jgi:hypothetical protein
MIVKSAKLSDTFEVSFFQADESQILHASGVLCNLDIFERTIISSKFLFASLK